MIIIGITGSIGMGKTTIASMLKLLRIPVFDADNKVKDILENDCYIKNKIFEKWPDTVHMQRKQKKINKNILSEKIFKNKKNKLFLERLIHPIVNKNRINFIKKNKLSFIIALDVPLLYETGLNKECDYVFLANTSINKQKKRVLKRLNVNENKFNLINASQWSYEKKTKYNPYLISTSYGKLISFIIILYYLFIIIFKHKVRNIERSGTGH